MSKQDEVDDFKLKYNQFKKLMKEWYLFNFKIDFLHKIAGLDTAYCFIYPSAANYLKTRDGMDVLDIGSLKTCFPQYIANKGGRVTIIDIDERVKIQRKYSKKLHQSDKVRIVLGNACKLPFNDSSFDAISCISVLQHIPHEGDISAMKEIARVLRASGRVFISLSYDQIFSVKNVRGRRWIHRYYDYNSLNKRLIEPSGLKVKKVGFLFDHKSRRITDIIYNKFPKYLRIGLGWSYVVLCYYLAKRDDANRGDADVCYIMLEKAP